MVNDKHIEWAITAELVIRRKKLNITINEYRTHSGKAAHIMSFLLASVCRKERHVTKNKQNETKENIKQETD